MKYYLHKHSVISILLCVFMAACGQGHDHADHEHSHEHGEHNHAAESHEHSEGEHDHEHEAHAAGEIVLEPAKARDAGVVVQTVAPSSFSEVIPTAGRILNSSGDEATVAATQPGIVTLTRPWAVGMNVNAGTPLFSISQSSLPEGDLSKKARIELDKATKEFNRIEQLYKEKLTTAAEFEQAKANLDNARLAVSALNNGGNGSVSAPKSGYVMQVFVKSGDYVDVGTPLMSISSTRRMRLQADLPVRNFSQINQVASANFKLPQSESVFSLVKLNGKVVSHSRSTSENSAYVPIIFEFDNAAGIVAGSFAEVWLLGNPRQGVICLPKSALVEEQGEYYVYLQEDEECYRKRRISRGATDGNRFEILDGIKAGDKVVTKGAMAVKLASMSGAIPVHTHEH
ncbi:MAG: efflux RND transporter periplasmic adaptor subunit [Muribaculaceae bacterium]|nr:efflux RND transporter periplasmic adaptor subunit [Muribaculaceae bacterium]